MADASYVQVALNSTGAKIRNLEQTIVQADGTSSTVQVQVVAITDAEGTLIEAATIHRIETALMELTELVFELRNIATAWAASQRS